MIRQASVLASRIPREQKFLDPAYDSHRGQELVAGLAEAAKLNVMKVTLNVINVPGWVTIATIDRVCAFAMIRAESWSECRKSRQQVT